jgi:uncharacterized repeat protein (TIGR01451 family)
MHRVTTQGTAVWRLAALVCCVVAVALAAPAVSAAAEQPDSKGTDFWLALPDADFLTSPQQIGTTTLFIAAEDATSGTVSIPRLAFTQPFAVDPGTITPVTVPIEARLLNAGVGPSIHVSAGKAVTVSVMSHRVFISDGYLGLPADALGTRYTVMAWGAGSPGQFAVAAAHDDTTVTVIPTSATVDGHPAGVAYTVTLNSGDAYLARAVTTPTGGELTGSIVTSDKPVAVFGGNECGSVPTIFVFACNPLMEQQPPDDAWGQTFLTVPLKTRVGGDTFRILASQDDTAVEIDGATVATLGAGEFHTQVIAGPSVISTSKPALVAQFSNGSTFDNMTNADPSMMLIAPVDQFQPAYQVPTPSGFAINEINLVAPSGSVGAIAIDGAAVPSSAYTPIGSSGFSGAQVDVTPGSHALTGTGAPFGVSSYGFDSFDAYSYPGGMAVSTTSHVATITLTPGDETSAVGGEGCVTALVVDDTGDPVARAGVDFTVSGANDASGSAATDADGHATFCYRGALPGADTLRAMVGTASARASKAWIVPAALPSTTTPVAPPAAAAPPARRRTPAARRGSLRLRMTAGKGSVRAGKRVSYRLTVSNPSRADVRGVRVCVRLPAGLVYVFSDPDARLDKGRRCWSVGTVRAGRSRVLKITTRALRGASGRRTTAATASGTGASGRAAVARVKVLGIAAAGGGVTG